MASASANAQPKKHEEGTAADLEKVTDYVEDAEIQGGDIKQVSKTKKPLENYGKRLDSSESL